MKYKSKFEYSEFCGGYDDFAVSKERYTKEGAVQEYIHQTGFHDDDGHMIAIGNAFVRHRAGIDEDGDRYVGWWLEYEEHNRSVPVWTFHVAFDTEDERMQNYRERNGYELIRMRGVV